jgi:hypothetical protein
MDPIDLQDQMARHCYGYGRWDAPFWFIGPEQGMSNDKRELEFRCQAWCDRNQPELDDCVEYHRHLNTFPAATPRKDWHKQKPPTQRTWARLIQFLIGYGVADDHLSYQKAKLGTKTGDTCILELSGLAAPSLSEKR